MLGQQSPTFHKLHFPYACKLAEVDYIYCLMKEFIEATGPWDEAAEEARIREAQQIHEASRQTNSDRATGQRLMRENFKAFPDLYEFSNPEE